MTNPNNIDKDLIGRVEAFINKAVLKAEQAIEIKKKESLSEDELCEVLVNIAKSYSVAPISEFYVGAVIEADSGNYYLGANYEFCESFLNQSIHAEQSAVINAYYNGENCIKKIVVNYLPCGHCRQFLEETRKTADFRILVPSDGVDSSLPELLPFAIGPEALGVSVKFLDRNRDYSFEDSAASLEEVARHVAKHNSYTPYTKLESGVALRTEKGEVVWGVAIENMAYNPSLTPMHFALSQLRYLKNNTLIEAVIYQKKHKFINVTDVAKVLIDSQDVVLKVVTD